jgi:hypothetical protein
MPVPGVTPLQSQGTSGIDMAPVCFELPLRCQGGHVSDAARQVAPSAVVRFRLLLWRLSAFPRFLQRPKVLDAAGGTDIVHVPTGRVTLSAGADPPCGHAHELSALRAAQPHAGRAS